MDAITLRTNSAKESSEAKQQELRHKSEVIMKEVLSALLSHMSSSVKISFISLNQPYSSKQFQLTEGFMFVCSFISTYAPLGLVYQPWKHEQVRFITLMQPF